MATQKLTAAFVNGVQTPGRYGDGGRGSFGLSLLVKPAKSGGLIKNWQQRYRTGGSYTSRGLGVYPAVSLEQARALAAHFALQGRPEIVRSIYGATDEQVAERIAPVRHEIRAEKTFAPMTAEVEVNREHRVPSFRRVFEESLELRARGFKAGSKTTAQAKSLFDLYITPEVASRPIDELTSRHLVDCLALVWRDKPATAKKLVQHLLATFNHGISVDLIDVSPLDKAKIGLGRLKPKGQNFRALPFSEVGAALAKVRASDAHTTTKLAMEYLTLTACRSGEVRGATWEEVDLTAGIWTIPADRMKGGREHRIPLSIQAQGVLKEALELTDGSGLVFPSERGKPLADNTISKLLRENAIAGTPHGMRSSFRDWAAEKTDFPSEIVEHALAHVEGSATVRAYRRTDYFKKRRELMEQWGTYVDALPF